MMTCDICTATPSHAMYTTGGHQLDLCDECLKVLMDGREVIDRWGFIFKRHGHVLTVRHVKVLEAQREGCVTVRASARYPLEDDWLEANRELLHGSLADRDGSEI